MAKRKKTRKKTNKKTSRKPNFSKELTAGLLLFISILGIAKLGFIGRFIFHLAELLVGQLALILFVLMIIMTVYFLFKGRPPKLRNRLVLAIAFGVPLVALLLHAWTYYEVAQGNENVFYVTWQRGIANFITTEPTLFLGGGLLGALLYLITYFTVSQLGTYILLGIGFVFILCLLLAITWQDLMDGFRMIGATISQFGKEFFKATKDQLVDYREQRQTQSKKSESSSSKRRSKRQQAVQEMEAAPQENNGDHDDFEIIGPQSPHPTENINEDSEETLNEVDDIPVKKNRIKSRPETDDNDSKDDENDELSASELAAISMDAEHDNPDYRLPTAKLLDPIKSFDQSSEYDVIKQNVKKLEATFDSFNVDAKVIKANLGPAVTKYEVQPAIGVKVSKIVHLADDIALALAAKDIRIEAPIPGKSFIGIEVPNQEVSLVSFRDSIENQAKTGSLLTVPLGRDISGNIQSADLTKMPHLLVAGSTGSGKSVAINGMIISLLMKAKPNEVKLMMIDPKKVELNVYNGIPHLLTPVVTNPRKAAQALNKVVEEMERRYELFATTSQRNIDGYNDYIREHNAETNEPLPKLPYIVVIVDELADLMMVASKEVEAAIMRLAQMARAAGIHMILATQRPSVDVITGIIKANVPSRIAFAVSSGTDSRTIIDQNGAEKLLGRGDMLFMPMGEGKPVRVQGAFISDHEVEKVVNFVKNQQEANYVEAMMPKEAPQTVQGEDLDDLWDEVLTFIKSRDTVSISMLQRQFRIGYNRSARLVDDLENHGYVGPQDGSKPRQVLINDEESES